MTTSQSIRDKINLPSRKEFGFIIESPSTEMTFGNRGFG